MPSAVASPRRWTEEATTPAPGERTRRRLRPGLVDFYLIRGVAAPFLFILIAVCIAMMLERALRLIHELAASGGDIGYFLPVLAQLAPYYLDLALPAAFMVALVLLVARLDDNLELEAMLASGLSMSRIAAPLVAFGLVVGLAGLVTGGWLEPLGRYGFRQLKSEAINAGRLGRLEPRALYQPADSLTLTFDSRLAQGRARGVFLWQRLDDGETLVLTGGSGRLGFVPGGRFGVDFARGRYLAEPARPARAHVIEFGALAFREKLRLRDTKWQRGWDQKELTLAELAAAAQGPEGAIPRRALEAELFHRIARAAVIPLLPLLVLPLAFATKRGHRTLGIVLTGTLLAAFHHGMNLAKQLALAGAADPAAAILGSALLCAAVILLVFWSGRKLPSHSPIASVLKRAGEVVPRRPARERALPILGGRALSSYLALQIGKWTLLALAAIVALLQMVDLFDRGEEFAARAMGFGDVCYYALLRLAPTVQLAIPVAVLAGAMVVFAGLARSHEMTAIRVAGVSQFRILAMALPVPALLAFGSLLLAEYGTPRSQLSLAAWWAATEPRHSPAAEPRWFRIGDEIVRAGSASASGARLRDVEIFRRDREGRLAERLRAGGAEAGARGWTLENVRITRFGADGPAESHVPRLDWRVALRPPEVTAFFTSANVLSAQAARRSLASVAPTSHGDALFTARLYRSAAEPLAPLVMLLLALPLAFAPPRTGVAWPMLLYAGGGGLLYLVADGVLTVAAQVGYVPAFVGAWAAPLIAGLTGITMLLYTER